MPVAAVNGSPLPLPSRTSHRHQRRAGISFSDVFHRRIRPVQGSNKRSGTSLENQEADNVTLRVAIATDLLWMRIEIGKEGSCET